MQIRRWTGLGAALLLAGCSGGDEKAGGHDEVAPPETYTFESRFEEGTSGVKYTGQIFRHVLIEDVKAYIGGLTASIDDASFTPSAGDVVDGLAYYYEFDIATSADGEPSISTTPARRQTQYDDLSASGAKLKEKIAGNDPEGQHKDWTVAGTLVGVTTIGSNGGQTFTPDSLVAAWFEKLDDLAVDWANGIKGTTPTGATLTKVHVTPQGQDLQQLIQKFLVGAIAFSQGTDDYLDDTIDGKGLLSDNEAQDGENPYTALEHAWDEGFGYFGASRDYGLRTDEAIATTPYFDTDQDGSIDLLSEYSFGHSVNASKRDNGSAESAPTDFSGEAFQAFLTGRAIITAAGGALTEHEMEHLVEQRDIAVAAWEKAIGASIVHYVNQVLVDMGTIGTGDYDFYDHAKHWSEMKGFSLALQFNPRSPVTDAQFADLQDLLGQAPVLTGTTELDAYRDDLNAAKDLLQSAYGFDDANMGDADGLAGW